MSLTQVQGRTGPYYGEPLSKQGESLLKIVLRNPYFLLVNAHINQSQPQIVVHNVVTEYEYL